MRVCDCMHVCNRAKICMAAYGRQSFWPARRRMSYTIRCTPYFSWHHFPSSASKSADCHPSIQAAHLRARESPNILSSPQYMALFMRRRQALGRQSHASATALHAVLATEADPYNSAGSLTGAARSQAGQKAQFFILFLTGACIF